MPKPSHIRTIVVYASLGGFVLSLLIIGLIRRDEAIGLIWLGAGLASLMAIGLGAWLGSWLGALHGSLVIAALALIASGIAMADATVAALGAAALIVVGAVASLTWIVQDRGFAPQPNERRAPPSQATMESLLQQLLDNSMLSEAAKRVLFRDRELQLLRHAIETHIANHDFGAANALCDELANLFGLHAEVQAYRARVQQAGQASLDAQVQQSLAQFDHILAARDWGQAHREAARLRRAYGQHPLIQQIDQRILNAREQHKHELESQFVDAANREDVDEAMPLLRELDRYLTRDEAARLSQTAQNVIMRHRENLSTQFRMAVNDHRWAEAARVGDTIIEQYPNTKMADEVRSLLDMLRVRATQAAVMAEGATS